MMWVQAGETALDMACLGPGGVWGNAESAYPAVIEQLLTNPSAVLVSVCTNRKWRRVGQEIRNTAENVLRCVCCTVGGVDCSKHLHLF